MQGDRHILKTYMIAEAGVNHNGDIRIAKKMIEAAKQSGASCVKFQSFTADELVAEKAQKAKYQIRNCSDKDESQYQMLKQYEMTYEMHLELLEYCKLNEIDFLSTAFGMQSIALLERLNLPKWKIPSGEITNYPYLRRIGRSTKPILLSTGMCFLEEIDQAIAVLEADGKKDITLLHCNTQYPTPPEDVNLSAMLTLRKKFGRAVGYSDHSAGMEAAIAAVALGASVVEKHFTLDRNMAGPDHQASVEPKELEQLVCAIRRVEAELGDGEKRVTDSERENIDVVRKSIVAACDIKKGEAFSEENLTTKRPGSGVSPMMWNDVLGRTAIRDFREDELIEI